MVCDICGRKGVRTRRVTRSYGQGDKLLVIENIPMNSCSSCGESNFTADALHEVERIKLHRRALAKKRSVPVARIA